MNSDNELASHDIKLGHCILSFIPLSLPVAAILSVVWNWDNDFWDTGWSLRGNQTKQQCTMSADYARVKFLPIKKTYHPKYEAHPHLDLQEAKTVNICGNVLATVQYEG